MWGSGVQGMNCGEAGLVVSFGKLLAGFPDNQEYLRACSGACGLSVCRLLNFFGAYEFILKLVS